MLDIPFAGHIAMQPNPVVAEVANVPLANVFILRVNKAGKSGIQAKGPVNGLARLTA